MLTRWRNSPSFRRQICLVRALHTQMSHGAGQNLILEILLYFVSKKGNDCFPVFRYSRSQPSYVECTTSPTFGLFLLCSVSKFWSFVNTLGKNSSSRAANLETVMIYIGYYLWCRIACERGLSIKKSGDLFLCILLILKVRGLYFAIHTPVY